MAADAMTPLSRALRMVAEAAEESVVVLEDSEGKQVCVVDQAALVEVLMRMAKDAEVN